MAVVLVGPLGESGEVRWLAAVIPCQRGKSCPENTDQLRWSPGAAGGRLARARLGRGVWRAVWKGEMPRLTIALQAPVSQASGQARLCDREQGAPDRAAWQH